MSNNKEIVFDTDRLNQMIREKKAQQDLDLIAIKDEITEIKDSLNPLKIIRNTVQEINENVGFKSELAQSAISIGIGYLAKKLIIGKTDSTFKNIIGSVLQLAITTLVKPAQQPEQKVSSQEYGWDE